MMFKSTSPERGLLVVRMKIPFGIHLWESQAGRIGLAIIFVVIFTFCPGQPNLHLIMHMAQLKCYLIFYFTVDISKNTLTQSPTPLKELEGGKNSEGNLFLFQTNKVDSLLVRLHINGSLSLTNLAMSISSGCLEGATCKIWLCALDTWENNYLCMYSKKSQNLNIFRTQK